MKKVLIISGQTATGKTDLGIHLAKKFNGEIISFDSRQAYKGLDVVTGKDLDKFKVKSEKLKVTVKNLKLFKYSKKNIPIWLYDLIDPKKHLNAYDFCQAAQVVINDILERKKLPIIVGGTVFYIKSFLEGFGHQGVGPDWQLRERLENYQIEKLQKMLKDLNNDRFLAMNESDRKNKRRLIRAIEIANSKFKIQNSKVQVKIQNSFDSLFIALVLDKEKLREKIEARVKERIKMGAVEEIQNLLEKGYRFNHPGLNTIGYKQLKDYWEKKISLNEAVANWIKAEVDYARRQLVFLKKMKNIIFLNPEESQFLEKTKQLVYNWYYDTSKN